MTRGEFITLIIPPNTMAAMTGAYKAEKSVAEIRLHYCDGSTETVQLDALRGMALDWANWFSIVSAVQSLRKPDAKAERGVHESL